ncbi:hypothetical protein [Nostocoides australiense]|nr:hypothetical protein [Tetrasphaera australiensis]
MSAPPVLPRPAPPRAVVRRLGLTAGALVALYGLYAGLATLGTVPPLPWSKTVATWTLPEEQDPTPATQELTVMVSRIECNGGRTGTLRGAKVNEHDDEVVVTTYVAKQRPGAYTCLGNDLKPLTVPLKTPLGERKLVDGACTDATRQTALCLDDGVRWPRAAD